MALSIDFLMSGPGKMKREQAARFVAGELRKAKCRIDGKAIDHKQLLEWRKRQRKDLSKQSGYRLLLRRRKKATSRINAQAKVRKIIAYLANGPRRPL